LRLFWRQYIAGWCLVVGFGRASRGQHRPPAIYYSSCLGVNFCSRKRAV